MKRNASIVGRDRERGERLLFPAVNCIELDRVA
jgi:hypothetical protein